jgi:hypothetical protein
VRERLQSQRLIPLCYAASGNLLLRDMANGFRAYRLVMGQRARLKDGVSSFDGLDIEAVSVQNKAEFYRVACAPSW